MGSDGCATATTPPIYLAAGARPLASVFRQITARLEHRRPRRHLPATARRLSLPDSIDAIRRGGGW